MGNGWMKLPRPLLTAAKALLALALLAYVLHQVDWAELLASVRGMHPMFPILAALSLAASVVTAALRWRGLLRVQGVEVSAGEVIRLAFLADFFSMVLLGMLGGDAVKAWYVARHRRHTHRVIVSVLFDRLLGVCGLAAFAAVMLAVLYALGAADDARTLLAPALSVAAVLAGVGMGAGVLLSPRLRALLHLQTLSARLPFSHHLAGAGHAIRTYLRDRPRLLHAVALTVLAEIFMIGSVALLGVGLGLGVPWYAYFLYVPLVIILSAVPITPGSVGVTEQLYVLYLSMAGPRGRGRWRWRCWCGRCWWWWPCPVRWWPPPGPACPPGSRSASSSRAPRTTTSPPHPLPPRRRCMPDSPDTRALANASAAPPDGASPEAAPADAATPTPPRRARRRPPLRIKLLLLAMGLLLGGALAEIGAYAYTHGWAWRTGTVRYAPEGDPPGTIRLAVLGGSTSRGTPYHDVMEILGREGERFTLLSPVKTMLHRRLGVPEVAIDSYAGPNWSAEDTVKAYLNAPPTRKRPDAVVIYSGQNEGTRYYSPNMTAPGAGWRALGWLQTGRLALRWRFVRQVDPNDREYRGDFFCDHPIPEYEWEFNRRRYRARLEQMLRHCRDEGIPVVLVIPQRNFLFPPCRSVYSGPAGRKAEALRRFKKAYGLRHYAQDAPAAQRELEELLAFCEFAHAHFELGEMLYQRDRSDPRAAEHLRRANDLDDFPFSIQQRYRTIVRELGLQYAVPTIDMHDVLLGLVPDGLPDYRLFVDDCHVSLPVYEALGRRILDELRRARHPKVPPAAAPLTILPPEWQRDLGIDMPVLARTAVYQADYFARQANYMFLRAPMLQRSLDLLGNLKVSSPTVERAVIRGKLGLSGRIYSERQRVLEWIRQDVDVPSQGEESPP